MRNPDEEQAPVRGPAKNYDDGRPETQPEAAPRQADEPVGGTAFDYDRESTENQDAEFDPENPGGQSFDYDRES